MKKLSLAIACVLSLATVSLAQAKEGKDYQYKKMQDIKAEDQDTTIAQREPNSVEDEAVANDEDTGTKHHSYDFDRRKGN